jgi:putative methanogenesis marker protein 3
VEIHLDGKQVEIGDGATLRDLLPERDPLCSVAVILPAVAESEQTQAIRISTSSGEVVVEARDPKAALLIATGLAGTVGVQWVDRYAAAFGPFATDMVPDRIPHRYERGDVILGCSGYDPKRSSLVFSKIRHTADHGASADGGVIGRVVSGRGILDTWTIEDKVVSLERLVSWADRSRSYITTNNDLLLEDGMQLVTYVAAVAEGYQPDGIDAEAASAIEHFLFTLQDGRFRVGRAASTHIKDDTAIRAEVPTEGKRPRREGAITVRAVGNSPGALYIYRTDLPGTIAHATVGQVTHGIELVKLAAEDSTLCMKVTPERIDLLGLSVREARMQAERRGLQIEIDATAEENIVISQEPATTMEVLAAGRVHLGTMVPEKVVNIWLDDAHAPATSRIFRKVTGLEKHRVGKMPLIFKFEDVFLFRPSVSSGEKINPENIPEDEVPAAALAMTNDARKGVGVVGVRTKSNREFGPTSEPFYGTNIIGSLLEIEKLKRIKERETVYIREVKQ